MHMYSGKKETLELFADIGRISRDAAANLANFAPQTS